MPGDGSGGDAPPSGEGDVFQVVGDVAELRHGQVLCQVVELLFRQRAGERQRAVSELFKHSAAPRASSQAPTAAQQAPRPSSCSETRAHRRRADR